jgi:hypothetical protein
MKYCGWWFQIKFTIAMWWSRFAEMFQKQNDEEAENRERAAYNEQQFKGDSR